MYGSEQIDEINIEMSVGKIKLETNQQCKNSHTNLIHLNHSILNNQNCHSQSPTLFFLTYNFWISIILTRRTVRAGLSEISIRSSVVFNFNKLKKKVFHYESHHNPP